MNKNNFKNKYIDQFFQQFHPNHHKKLSKYLIIIGIDFIEKSNIISQEKTDYIKLIKPIASKIWKHSITNTQSQLYQELTSLKQKVIQLDQKIVPTEVENSTQQINKQSQLLSPNSKYNQTKTDKPPKQILHKQNQFDIPNKEQKESDQQDLIQNQKRIESPQSHLVYPSWWFQSPQSETQKNSQYTPKVTQTKPPKQSRHVQSHSQSYLTNKENFSFRHHLDDNEVKQSLKEDFKAIDQQLVKRNYTYNSDFKQNQSNDQQINNLQLRVKTEENQNFQNKYDQKQFPSHKKSFDQILSPNSLFATSAASNKNINQSQSILSPQNLNNYSENQQNKQQENQKKCYSKIQTNSSQNVIASNKIFSKETQKVFNLACNKKKPQIKKLQNNDKKTPLPKNLQNIQSKIKDQIQEQKRILKNQNFINEIQDQEIIIPQIPQLQQQNQNYQQQQQLYYQAQNNQQLQQENYYYQQNFNQMQSLNQENQRSFQEQNNSKILLQNQGNFQNQPHPQRKINNQVRQTQQQNHNQNFSIKNSQQQFQEKNQQKNSQMSQNYDKYNQQNMQIQQCNKQQQQIGYCNNQQVFQDHQIALNFNYDQDTPIIHQQNGKQFKSNASYLNNYFQNNNCDQVVNQNQIEQQSTLQDQNEPLVTGNFQTNQSSEYDIGERYNNLDQQKSQDIEGKNNQFFQFYRSQCASQTNLSDLMKIKQKFDEEIEDECPEQLQNLNLQLSSKCSQRQTPNNPTPQKLILKNSQNLLSIANGFLNSPLMKQFSSQDTSFSNNQNQQAYHQKQNSMAFLNELYGKDEMQIRKSHQKNTISLFQNQQDMLSQNTSTFSQFNPREEIRSFFMNEFLKSKNDETTQTNNQPTNFESNRNNKQ